MQLCDKRTTSPATGEGGKCISKPGLAQPRNDEVKERIHKSYILQVCQQMSQKPRQFRRVSVWPALDEPTLWLERKALRGGAPLFCQKWSRGPATLCFGDPFLPVHLSRQTTSRASSAEPKTSSRSKHPQLCRRPNKEGLHKKRRANFLDRLSSQSFPYGALYSAVSESQNRLVDAATTKSSTTTLNPSTVPRTIAVIRHR